jgi:hypothetical protein
MAPKEKDHRFHIIASEKTKFKMLSYCVNFLKRLSNFFRRNFLRRQRRNRVSTLQRSEEDLLMEKFDEILYSFSIAGVLNLLLFENPLKIDLIIIHWLEVLFKIN